MCIYINLSDEVIADSELDANTGAVLFEASINPFCRNIDDICASQIRGAEKSSAELYECPTLVVCGH